MFLSSLRSDRVHFGVVESQGGGKFICHVFAEYKVSFATTLLFYYFFLVKTWINESYVACLDRVDWKKDPGLDVSGYKKLILQKQLW